MEKLAQDPMERLRWLVLRDFCIIPGSRRAKAVSDEDILRCAAHMLIDSRSFENGQERGENDSFDEERFRRLSEGRR